MGRQRPSQDELSRAVERERKRAAVRSLDISFNELADMYREEEIHIEPVYQRLFRWSLAKQSRFIESVILEMPIPPIYMVEVAEAKWELIDGLQRFSTYLHLRGDLHLPDNDPPIRRGADYLTLVGCDIVRQLNGLKFEDLTTTFQHRVRRAALRVEVVRRETNPRFAFHMFKRLNTGGEVLSDQEARNCSVRLLGSRFVDFITKVSGDTNFQGCIADITDEYRNRMGVDELVLRFFAFKNNMGEYVHDIEPFLTDFMERVTDQETDEPIAFDYPREEQLFRKTFRVLNATLQTKAFSRWVKGGNNSPEGNYAGGFSMGHYEAFSLGVAAVIESISDTPDATELEKIKGALEASKKDPELSKHTVGGGKNFRRIYEAKIALVADKLRAVL